MNKLILIVLLVAAGGGAAWWFHFRNGEAPVKYRTAKVERG